MKKISEIEKLEKELKRLDEKRKEFSSKLSEKESELRNKIESLKEEDAKKKLSEKFYNKVVHVIDARPHYGIYQHYIGMIKPDTVCSQGFYMYKDALYVRIDNDVITCIHLEDGNGGFCGVKVNPHELFKNGTVTYGDDSPRNRKRTFTIKIASNEDSDFIRKVFETKKKQDNAEMDKLRDSCISMIG